MDIFTMRNVAATIYTLDNTKKYATESFNGTCDKLMKA